MAQELQQLRTGDTFAGRYRVVRLIRAGGMGAVYEVEDSSTRRRRALKIMHPSLVQSADSRARFEREVFIGAELETEHVVEVLDAGLDQASQVPFLTMELLKGEELGDRLERVGRMSPIEAIDVLSQISRALDKAHQRGIVHRDLKPENIYLTLREDGSMRAKILDFGIAKLLEGAHTNATQAAGTPLYMAPEQTDKMGHVSPATDVWAIGLVAYRMLVGTSYWQGDSLQQLYRQILMDPLTSPVQRAAASGASLPPAFDYWFSRCVVRNPQERFPSAGQAVAELANLFGVPAQRVSGPSNPGGPGYDMTAPPVANVTPGQGPSHPMATMFAAPQPTPYPGQSGPGLGGTPVPLNMTPARMPTPHPNVTPYPAPQITPSNHEMAYAGTQVTPAPNYGPPPSMQPQTERASISGTQMAPPGIADYRASQPGGYGPPPAAAPAPTKGPPIGLIVGGILGAGALLGLVIFLVTKPPANAGPTPTPTNTAAPPVDTTPKPKPVKEKWQAKVEGLNPFHNVGAKSFALQQHEITREEFSHYVAGESDALKPLQNFSSIAAGNKEKLPVTWVTFEASDDFCKKLGGHVPTAEEWDAAVAGPTAQKYPWGKDWPKADSPDFRDLAAGKKGMGIIEVEKSPYDKGPYGNFDLAGNVQEWTSSTSKAGPDRKLLRGTDINGDESIYLDPGELFFGDPSAADTARAGAEVGFRCARDVK